MAGFEALPLHAASAARPSSTRVTLDARSQRMGFCMDGGSIKAGEMASGKPFDAAPRVGFGPGCFQSPWTDVSSAPGSAASPAVPPIPCVCRA